ncbi:MAG: DUF5615 family PIN-like protein [Gemmataceae bacterium]|nr:DUF5615 family PIN-like protein [Gemmataceae bacterium]
MSAVAFLLDENIPAPVRNALIAVIKGAHIRMVGVDPDVPPKQTTDPDLLVFAEAEGLSIVTFDKDTMPGHAADHVAAGRHTWGVFVFPNGNNMSAGQIAAELAMVCGASQRDEWIDLVLFLPL